MSWHQRELEVARHHANHDIRLAVEQELASEHVRIAVQAVLPERVTDHRYLFFLIIFLLGKEPAHQRPELQSWKHPA